MAPHWHICNISIYQLLVAKSEEDATETLAEQDKAAEQDVTAEKQVAEPEGVKNILFVLLPNVFQHHRIIIDCIDSPFNLLLTSLSRILIQSLNSTFLSLSLQKCSMY